MKLGACPCINEPVPLDRHGKALSLALRFFGTSAENSSWWCFSVELSRVGRPFAQAHVKPPLVVRILSVFLRESCPGKTGTTWAEVSLLGFLGGSRLALDLLGHSLSVNFMGRVGYGFCFGLGCLELRVFLSFRCLLGLRGLALGCGRRFRTPRGFSLPGMADCFLLCIGRLEFRHLALDRLALGRFLCRCCLLCSGRRTPLLALGGFGC